MSDRDALHEAGHLVVASVLGRKLYGATVNPGTRLAGCSLFASPDPIPAGDLAGVDVEDLPFVLWPASLRRNLEEQALISLAGPAAELALAGPVAGRVPDPVAVLAAELVAGEADLAWAAQVVDEAPHPSDADSVAQAAFVAFGRDAGQAGPWISWLDAQARELVICHESLIRRLAGCLVASQVLGAAALEAIISGSLVAVPG